MDPITAVACVAGIAIFVCGGLAGVVLWTGMRQRLVMSEAMRDVAIAQDRALAHDTGLLPIHQRAIKVNGMDATSLRTKYAQMQNRGAMDEVDEQLFGPVGETARGN